MNADERPAQPEPVGHVWVIKPPNSPFLAKTMRPTMGDCICDFRESIGEDVWLAMEESGTVVIELALVPTGSQTTPKLP